MLTFRTTVALLVLLTAGCSDSTAPVPAHPEAAQPLEHLERQLRRAEDTLQQQQQQVQSLEQEIQRLTGAEQAGE